MGFDLYGMNPKENYKHPKRYKEIVEKYGDGTFINHGDTPKDVQSEYFELKDKYQEENPGHYFRNNVWWWRPLWEFVCHHCFDYLTPKDMAKGHINDGHIISKTKATKIGKRLLKLIENKTVDRDVNEHTLIMEKAKANNDILDKQKENLKNRVTKILGKEVPPMDYPEKYKEEWNRLQDQRQWDEHYPFNKDNVRNFAEFCLQSGGFQIS